MGDPKAIRTMLSVHYGPYLRGEAYKRVFTKILDLLDESELEGLTDREIFSTLFHMLLADAFERLERLERAVGD